MAGFTADTLHGVKALTGGDRYAIGWCNGAHACAAFLKSHDIYSVQLYALFISNQLLIV